MLQLNAKELKDFRENIAKWHIADFDKKDAQITRQRKIKLNEAKIEDYRSEIEKVQNGTMKVISRTIDERIAEIEDMIATLDAENEDAKKVYEAHAESLDVNFEAGRKLVSEKVVTALETYLDDIYNDDAEITLLNTLVEWFTENGAKGVVVDDVRKYIRPIGRKGASAKKSLETGRHTTREKGNKLKDAFLGGLCDDNAFISLLPVYTWTNKIEKKSKKKNK